MARHNQIGKWGENVACDELKAKGYAIVERNCRLNHCEVDIIAKKGNRLAFVEVKARGAEDFDIRDILSSAQQSRMARAAHAYLKTHETDLEIQFDFFLVTGDPHAYKVEHLEDVYIPALKTYR